MRFNGHIFLPPRHLYPSGKTPITHHSQANNMEDVCNRDNPLNFPGAETFFEKVIT